LRSVLLSLTLCAISAAGQVRDDTARLLARVQPFRGSGILELSAEDYRSIQDAYLEWIDARVAAKSSVEAMNAELSSAGLLYVPPRDQTFSELHVGYLDPVSANTIASSTDLLAIAFRIETGGNCDSDDTAALYNRASLRRIALVNAELRHGHGFWLRALDVGPSAADGSRIIGSMWAYSNCTSNWNGDVFRIDRSINGSVVNVLERPLTDMQVFNGDDLTVEVDPDDTVNFGYFGRWRHTEFDTHPSLDQYKVQGIRAARTGLLALSFGGFIDEWLDLTEPDVREWSSSEAAATHPEFAALAKETWFKWTGAADCPNLPAREISVEWNSPKRTTFFLVGGSRPEDLRMLAVSNTHSQACRQIELDPSWFVITRDPGNRR
jgi:hypothetical protein